MGDILLKMTSPSALTYHVKNFSNLDIAQELPAMIYALPESTEEKAIGIKVEGNLSTITVSWTLVNEDSTVVDQLTGSNAVETADEQMGFLLDDFQPVGATAAYQIQLLPNSGSAFFIKNGIITKLNITKSGDAPVTYMATVVFSVADMTVNNE